jgi:hypothetical protein
MVSDSSGGLPDLKCHVCDQPEFKRWVKIREMMYREAQGLESLLARKEPRETAAVCLGSNVMRAVEWVGLRGGCTFLKSRTRQRRRIAKMSEIGKLSEVSLRCSFCSWSFGGSMR